MANCPFSKLVPAVTTAALVAALASWGCGRDAHELSAPVQRNPAFSIQGPQQGGLEAALAVHQRHADRLITLPGVAGTAVGLTSDGRPAIKIYVTATGVAGVPKALEGIPTVVEVTGEFVALPAQGTSAPGQLRRSSLAYNTSILPIPVPIGVSTSVNGFLAGFCFSGTIGARVIDGSGSVYALSNNHVYALENTAALGSHVFQPGLADTGCDPSGSNDLGTLFAFAPIVFDGTTDNTIDAAIAASSTIELGNSTPTSQGGYGIPNSSTTAAFVGQSVQKYGRTSSLTKGTVSGIDATVLVGYLSGTAKFVHQIVVGPGKPFIKAGDSGSLLVTNDAHANPVGLLFAGNSSGSVAIANRIDLVLSHSYGGVTVTVDGTTR